MDVQPIFKLGDRVKAVALPDAFPSPRAEHCGLTVTRIRRIDSSFSLPVYYRIVAEGHNAYYEGAERFFAPEQA